ncbi:bestrophin-4 [Ixodes scapularis]|uniref:bestrophin-4 n=1 Tax=Ixodes scapularis TaxID=6945 RepID=UPI001A9DD1CA|nr:bestrophin-4 [Ixodes scapularis]
MTVTYTAEVATSRGFGCFWKLLFRWKGSIYKLVWPDLGVYLAAYYSLNFLYRFILSNERKLFFEHVCVYCGNFADLIPVSFVLGFYVSVVVKRWWDSFSSIPWPDSLAFFVSTFLQGQDDRGRLMRRTIMRYANLSSVITLRCISPPVKKRFPTLDHLVDAGLLLGSERDVFEQLKTNHSTYWMPLVWASSVASRARKEGRIRDDFALKTIVDEIAHYRSNCGSLFNFDWISIPLVYTQVTTLAVYTFFLATLFGSQGLDPNAGYKGHEIDLYVPIFNFLRFFFYMGWLKVAETLVNPFGEDDDDFEMNWVIDRNIQVSYLVVDEMHQNHPELLKDQYWNEVMPPELPYTLASRQFYCFPHQGSTACMIIPPNKASFVSRDKLAANTPLRGALNEKPFRASRYFHAVQQKPCGTKVTKRALGYTSSTASLCSAQLNILKVCEMFSGHFTLGKTLGNIIQNKVKNRSAKTSARHVQGQPKEPEGTGAKDDILSSSVEDDPSTVVYMDGGQFLQLWHVYRQVCWSDVIRGQKNDWKLIVVLEFDTVRWWRIVPASVSALVTVFFYLVVNVKLVVEDV